MKRNPFRLIALIALFYSQLVSSQVKTVQDPIIWADVPDMSMIRADMSILTGSVSPMKEQKRNKYY